MPRDVTLGASERHPMSTQVAICRLGRLLVIVILWYVMIVISYSYTMLYYSYGSPLICDYSTCLSRKILQSASHETISSMVTMVVPPVDS